MQDGAVVLVGAHLETADTPNRRATTESTEKEKKNRQEEQIVFSFRDFHARQAANQRAGRAALRRPAAKQRQRYRGGRLAGGESLLRRAELHRREEDASEAWRIATLQMEGRQPGLERSYIAERRTPTKPRKELRYREKTGIARHDGFKASDHTTGRPAARPIVERNTKQKTKTDAKRERIKCGAYLCFGHHSSRRDDGPRLPLHDPHLVVRALCARRKQKLGGGA